MPLRILITGTVGESLPPPYAGIPKLSLTLAQMWKKLGHEVALTFVHRHEREDDLGAKAKYFFEYKNKPNKIKKLFFLVSYFLKNPLLYCDLLIRYLSVDRKISLEAVLYAAYGVFLDQVIKKFRPSIILAEAALIKTYMAALVARRRGIPIVFDTYAEIHDLTIGINKRLLEPELKKYWEPYLNMAALIISPSFYCVKGPLTYVAEEKVKVVYPGIDIALCTSQKEYTREDLRKYFKLPKELFLIIAVGAFTWRKGHDHLIRAAAKLARLGLPVGVVLCGPGETKAWREIAKEEGMEDKIFFFSGLSEIDLTKLYNAVDLYCDASNTPRACLGLSLSEGIAAGLPAVAYDNAGLPELVHDGENGFLVPLNDIEGLTNAILRVYQLSPEERQILGKKGSDLMRVLVDMNKIAEHKLNLLESVAMNK